MWVCRNAWIAIILWLRPYAALKRVASKIEHSTLYTQYRIQCPFGSAATFGCTKRPSHDFMSHAVLFDYYHIGTFQRLHALAVLPIRDTESMQPKKVQFAQFRPGDDFNYTRRQNRLVGFVSIRVISSMSVRARRLSFGLRLLKYLLFCIVCGTLELAFDCFFALVVVWLLS